MQTKFSNLQSTTRVLTFRQAAAELNVPYFKIQRAAKAGLIPTYSFLNSRMYVRLDDIQALMFGGEVLR